MLEGLPAEFVFSCSSSRSAAALTISTKLCAQLALHLSQPINAALWGKRLAMECRQSLLDGEDWPPDVEIYCGVGNWVGRGMELTAPWKNWRESSLWKWSHLPSCGVSTFPGMQHVSCPISVDPCNNIESNETIHEVQIPNKQPCITPW